MSDLRHPDTRVAVLLPSLNVVLEPALWRFAPAGFTFHSVRLELVETTPEGLRRMNASVPEAARIAASVAPDLCLYGCTSGSFIEGSEGLSGLVDAIAAVVGCPVVATSRAVLEALTTVGARRVALATPYLDQVNALEIGFLEAAGFGVASWKGLGLSGTAIREVGPAAVRDLVRDADDADADAVFVSCTDLRALEVVDELEAVLGKPVVTSNQASLWGLLRRSGWQEPVVGAGTLLREGLRA